jgi:hypothetical protein
MALTGFAEIAEEWRRNHFLHDVERTLGTLISGNV